MSIQFSKVKVIHFEVDKNKLAIISKEPLPIFNNEVSGKSEVYEMLDKPPECKVVVELRYRFTNDKGEQFGSFISEQFFYITYINEEQTLKDVNRLFDEARFYSLQKLDGLKEEQNISIQLLFQFRIPSVWIQQTMEQLKFVFDKHQST